MFETHSVRPRRSAMFFFSAALHAGIGLLLVVGPLWAVQDPVDPVERIRAIEVDLSKKDAPIRISERPPVRPSGAHSVGGPARNLKHVAPPTMIPELPAVAAVEEKPGEPTETLGESQVGSSGANNQQSGRGDDGVGTADDSDSIYAADALDVVPPVALVTTEPFYPEAARRAHLEGDTILEAVIDRDGRVRDVRILKSVNPLLDRAALVAVSTWRYRPALIGTRAVAVYLTVRISFHLH